MMNKTKKILFFQWHSFMNPGMERALKELDIAYDTYYYQFKDWEKDDKFIELFQKQLEGKDYRCVLSVNFSPLISNVCEEKGLTYVSWVYDSPLHIHDLEPLKNSCNRFYHFDRGQAEEYRKSGVDAKHMPLAVDPKDFNLNVPASEKAKYATDVALVGKLYQTDYQYFTAPLNPYLKGYLEGLVSAQMKIYGGFLLPELISEDLLKQMNEEYARVATDGFQMGYRELEYMLACETTCRERYTVLALLSNHFKVDLYSSQQDERLKNVRFKGYADYYTQMPLVFSQSKINLNMTLKCIRTGIPLRVTDIMGCGGFVLTSFQEEIAEYFAIGEECVVYENIEDLFMKAQYYIKHDTERQKIATAGFERVKRDFTFKERIAALLRDVE